MRRALVGIAFALALMPAPALAELDPYGSPPTLIRGCVQNGAAEHMLASGAFELGGGILCVDGYTAVTHVLP